MKQYNNNKGMKEALYMIEAQFERDNVCCCLFLLDDKWCIDDCVTLEKCT